MEMRRSCPLVLSLTFCVVILSALLFLANNPAVALDTTRYVATTGVDTGTCDNANHPCATVQYAVDQADHKDTIRVAGGTYSGVQARPVPAGYDGAPASGIVTQVVYLTKTVAIEGGYSAPLYTWPLNPEANPTTLDAEGRGRVILVSSYVSPTFQGLRITGGDAAGAGGDQFGNDVGGGIHIDRATVGITNTRVFSNTADRGGGVHVWYADLTLYQSDILSNTGNTSSGGLHVHESVTRLDGNAFTANNGVSGAGLLLAYSTVDLYNNLISGNTATFDGGGARIFSCEATLDSNIITGNSAIHGGGLLISYFSKASMFNNVLANNQASGHGSGLYVQRSDVKLLHTTIADNSQGDGSGLYITHQLTDYSTVALTNTILVSHTVGIYASTGNTVTVESTLWHGNGADTSGTITLIAPNIDKAPGFASPASRNYHLAAGSAAVDAGADAGVGWDMDGQRRPMLGSFDLGADEVPWAVYLPLVSRLFP